MHAHLTIVGGGIGGLVTAIAAREAGFDVTVHEARRQVGGRARTTDRPYLANWGPHVLYSDGPLWRWLDERDLARPAGRVPRLARPRFRVDGRGRSLPPAAVALAAVKLRRREAPVDRSFREWATEVVHDEEIVARLASAMGVATFHWDPGALSASFVHERLRRVTALPPSARYVNGGWAELARRLARRAEELGARIETGSRVDALPEPPVVLAVPLPAAAALLGDVGLTWTGTRVALLDVAFRARRGDPFFVSDLDESGWAESYDMADPSLAPVGERLVQAQIGLRPDEPLERGVERIEDLLDVGYGGWRARVTWRRRLKVVDETGAVDLPGTSWRDRPDGDRGGGVHLVGDMVAAPGLLAEVAHRSALDAVDRLAAEVGRAAGAAAQT